LHFRYRSGHITSGYGATGLADPSPKLPLATSHIRQTLAKISNSPFQRKGNLNHQKKRGLASFNQKTRGKEHESDCYATRHNKGKMGMA